MENPKETSDIPKTLSEEDKTKLAQQNTRLVTSHKALQLEKEARKFWDLFYKRNGNRFFKDRHWTTREFTDLLPKPNSCTDPGQEKTLLEIGCGVGNFIFPLIEENPNLHVIACDISPRAIELVKSNDLYNPERIQAFQTDITTDDILEELPLNSVDIVTLIFVLSAIHPDKFLDALRIIWKLLKPGGVVLFRDYGLYDMAQIRFKPGHKIAENFYMRQDGTRSYYFSTDFLSGLFTEAGFDLISNCYIHRRTVNVKEKVDVPRVFAQVVAVKSKHKSKFASIVFD